jgi:hypothetical protein
MVNESRYAVSNQNVQNNWIILTGRKQLAKLTCQRTFSNVNVDSNPKLFYQIIYTIHISSHG